MLAQSQFQQGIKLVLYNIKTDFNCKALPEVDDTHSYFGGVHKPSIIHFNKI